MVRAVLACVWCRRQKIKCVHDGTGPCRTCVKAKRTAPGECVLTGPPFHNMYSPQRARNPSSQRSRDPSGVINDEHGSVGEFQIQQQHGSQNSGASLLTPPDLTHPDPRRSIAQRGVTMKLANTFKRTFPELAFLKLAPNPKEIQDISGRNFDPLLEEALMCLCARFLGCNDLDSSSNSEDIEALAVKVEQDLSKSFDKPPTITIVQTYLIMSMYEWGSGNGYLSWMYSGMAIRMIQSLQAIKKDKVSTDFQEIENRTFWSCFIMDRLIFITSSGATQPLVLPFDKLNVSLPVGEQDFVFGLSSEPRIIAKNFAAADSIPSVPCDPDHYYSVLVRGFDIWARVLELVIAGGRRQPEMARPDNCPWVKSSPWNQIYESLEKWRDEQHSRLKFPRCPVAPHVSLGQGEAFAFVNLIYFVSTLFLHREYIPFVPTKESEPSGPIDPPILEETAPEGWWDRGSAELFHAASCITRILQDLEICGAPLFTPFTGFCAFSAAIMNLYVGAFPRMNLHRSPNGAELARLNIQYLDRFQKLWKMGIGWCKTVEQTQWLYRRINDDQALFHGKTRVDFEALEASIQDYAGTSPVEVTRCPPSGGIIEGRNDALSLLADASSQALNASNSINETALSGQPSPYQTSADETAFASPVNAIPTLESDNFWSEPWPLWGDHQFMPYAIGGSPFDYNLNMDAHIPRN